MRESLGYPEPVYSWGRNWSIYDLTFNANVVVCWKSVYVSNVALNRRQPAAAHGFTNTTLFHGRLHCLWGN